MLKSSSAVRMCSGQMARKLSFPQSVNMLLNNIRVKPAISSFSSMSSHPLSWLFPSSNLKRNCFVVRPDQIEVLTEPGQFYDKLKELTARSKKRITLSSLYIGNGKLEREYVDCLKLSQDRTPDLETTILLDYTRGNRITGDSNARSSKELLLPLVGPSCNISFYLSPSFSSWFNRNFILPNPKWNEIIGLQHMKCFLFDDDLIISGANLSDQYFVNRNDRYIWFKNCRELCDYYDDLVKTVSTFSLQLTPDGNFKSHRSWLHDVLETKKSTFCHEAQHRLKEFQSRHPTKCLDSVANESTFVMPFLQLKHFGINDDQEFTSYLLSNAARYTSLKLASGYFNLTDHYSKLLTSIKKVDCKVLMASEQVNSFYKAKGLSGYIPSVYTHLAKVFLRSLKKSQSSVELFKFNRANWTFHAKGLWLEFGDKHMLTTIGSPNYGYRSVERDLESQLVIVTSDEKLKQQFREEYKKLWQYAEIVKEEKELPHVPRWVQFLTPLIKSFF